MRSPRSNGGQQTPTDPEADIDQTLAGARRAVNHYLAGTQDPVDTQPAEAPGPGVRLFSALTGETTAAIETDPAAFVRGVEKLGGDLQGLVRDYFSADESVRQAARQRLQQLGETFRQHGIGGPEPETSGLPGAQIPPPEAGIPTVNQTTPKAISLLPDPGDVFRERLHEILTEVVGRLEELADDVLPDRENEVPASD